MAFTVPEIIRKKRDNKALETEEIDFFVESVVNGTAQESQIGAWLMAVFLNGMNDRETADLTKAMVQTGEHLQWKDSWKEILVDKHSTGGVGDKISLVLAPALAVLGLKVPMLSGRGLGFTGGTLDKLESIPGFKVQLTYEEMFCCLNEVGCFIAGQTFSLAPCDKILYASRDLTQTVDCIPLIVSSVLSKKAVEGIATLVMDVKVGRGSNMRRQDDAEELAQKLIDVSRLLEIDTTAVLTDMNAPIGCCIGNSLEVMESVDCLRNTASRDVMNLVKLLGGVLLHKKRMASSVQDGEKKIEEVLRNKSALNTFKSMIMRQGVTKEVAEELCSGNYTKVLPQAPKITRYTAQDTGIVTDINAENIALLCWHLGAGRNKAGASIDYSVGVKLLKVIGDEVKIGDDWIEIHHSKEITQEMDNLIRKSIRMSTTQPCNAHSRILKLLH